MSDSEEAQTGKFQSRKYRMTAYALISVMLVFFISVGIMLFKGEIAPSIVSLAQVVVTSLGGLAAVYTGSQAWVEGKSKTP